MHSAYQKAIKDKDILENDNQMLRNEVKRLLKLVPNDYTNSTNSLVNNTDEDFGYVSAKNTLEMKKGTNNVKKIIIENASTPKTINANKIVNNTDDDNIDSNLQCRLINFQRKFSTPDSLNNFSTIGEILLYI